ALSQTKPPSYGLTLACCMPFTGLSGGVHAPPVATMLVTVLKKFDVNTPFKPGESSRIPAQAAEITLLVTVLPVPELVHEASKWMPDSSLPMTVFDVTAWLLLHTSIPSNQCVE